MKLTLRHFIYIGLGLISLVLDIIFVLPTESRFGKPLIAISLFIGTLPFFIDVIREAKRQRELEEKFLEFTRNLSDTVRSGVPIPKAVIQVSTAEYGSLNPYVKKLARQIEWGFPMKEALINFAKSTQNRLIKRSISIVVEAERRGGHIQDVLNAVTESVLQVKKIKDERRSNTFAQLIQGYVVFFMFIGIMIVLQIYLLPQLNQISGIALEGFSTGGLITGDKSIVNPALINFELIFAGLILVQGLFAGLLIGKFAEGNFRVGLKHSLILMLGGYLIFALATG